MKKSNPLINGWVNYWFCFFVAKYKEWTLLLTDIVLVGLWSQRGVDSALEKASYKLVDIIYPVKSQTVTMLRVLLPCSAWSLSLLWTCSAKDLWTELQDFPVDKNNLKCQTKIRFSSISMMIQTMKYLRIATGNIILAVKLNHQQANRYLYSFCIFVLLKNVL